MNRNDFFSIPNIKNLVSTIQENENNEITIDEDFLNQLKSVMSYISNVNPTVNLSILNYLTVTDMLKLIEENRIRAEKFIDNALAEDDTGDKVSDNVLVTTDGKTRELFIHIDSRYRDVKQWKNPSRYRFSINGVNEQLRGIINAITIRQVRNLIEVRLVDAMVGNINNPVNPAFTETPYLYLNIDEIDGDTYTTFLNGYRVFGKMSNIIATNQIRSFTPLAVDRCVKIYETYEAKDSLPNMTINILDPSGELYDFGPDALDIVSISAANPTEITTSVDHLLATDNTVYLVDVSGTDADSTLNRIEGFDVTVTGATTFTVPVEVTVASSGGYVLIGKRQNNFLFSIKMLPQEVSQIVK